MAPTKLKRQVASRSQSLRHEANLLEIRIAVSYDCGEIVMPASTKVMRQGRQLCPRPTASYQVRRSRGREDVALTVIIRVGGFRKQRFQGRPGPCNGRGNSSTI